MKNVDIIVFSPTGSTRKIASTVAESLGSTVNLIDVTRPSMRFSVPELRGDAVILAVPVYEEYVPELLLPFFERLQGSGQPTVLIAVYGNIHMGRALNQLAALVRSCNLTVIAAAAFVAEHSFSTAAYPVASGRPDQSDLHDARHFGEKILEKVNGKSLDPVVIPFGKLSLMSRLLPKKSAKFFSKAPKINKHQCNGCGLCAKLCPVGAIDQHTLNIDKNKCIRCFSCVKQCPYNARKMSFKLPLFAWVFVRQGAKPKKNLFFL